MATLKPVNKKDTWAFPLEKALRPEVSKIYSALPRYNRETLNVTASPLERAIASGEVTLSGNVFSLVRGAAVSREVEAMGGKYLGDGRWEVPMLNIPYRLRQLAYQAKEAKGAWVSRLTTAAQTLAPLALAPELLLGVYKTLDDLVLSKIKATTSTSPYPQYFESRAQDFRAMVETSLQGFSEKEKIKLLAIIDVAGKEDWAVSKLEMALAGREGVAKDRAKAIARQSMSVAVTNIKADYYIAAGLPKYMWKTKGDSLVRADHQILDGEIFEWANPPVVNTATGYRGHPGQAANCRCEALPIQE